MKNKMMKNKKNLYILLPAVVFVWGLIAYRIFAGVNPNEPAVAAAQELKKFNPKLDPEPISSYEITADYRDPFLDEMDISKPKKAFAKTKKQVQEIEFPEIEYKGIIKTGNNSKAIFLIVINGNRKMFKLKETHDDVKLIKGNEERITLKYNTEKRSYLLED
jgi:hypothetical protein